MKRFFIALCVTFLACFANAQTIVNLDETTLLGEWTVSDYGGVWANLGYRWPKHISLNDGAKSYIEVSRSADGDYDNLEFCGYWVGGTATGKYTLHLICRRDYDSDYTALSTVNFVITNFNDGKMTLTTYDGGGWASFTHETSSISETRADDKSDGAMYSLDGKKIESPNGIYIRNGTKHISK